MTVNTTLFSDGIDTNKIQSERANKRTSEKAFFSIKLIGHSIEWSGDGVEHDGGDVVGSAGKGNGSDSGGSDKCLNRCLVTPTLAQYTHTHSYIYTQREKLIVAKD